MADDNYQNPRSSDLPQITPGTGIETKSGHSQSSAGVTPAQTAVPQVLPAQPSPPVDGAAMPKIKSVPGGGGGVKMKMKRAAQIGVAPVQMVTQLPSFAYRHRKALITIAIVAGAVIFTASYFAKKAHDAKIRDQVLAGSQRSMDKVNSKFADASSLQEMRLVTNTVKYEKGTNGGRSKLLTEVSGGDRSALAALLAAEGELLGAYASLAGATQANLASKRKTDAMIADIKAAVKKLQTTNAAVAAEGIVVMANPQLLTKAQKNILALLREARGRKPKATERRRAAAVGPGVVVAPQPAPSGGGSSSSGSTKKRDSGSRGSDGAGGGNGGGGNGGGGFDEQPGSPGGGTNGGGGA